MNAGSLLGRTDRLKPEDLEELVSQLNDLTVEVEGQEKVRIFCE
jgi:hypothetical protein